MSRPTFLTAATWQFHIHTDRIKMGQQAVQQFGTMAAGFEISGQAGALFDLG